MAFDIFTGAEVADGESVLKKMCLNCAYCLSKEDGTYACNNEDVLEKGKEKILAAIPEEYKVAPIQIQEMALKNPTKKCGQYSADIEFLTEMIEFYFLDKNSLPTGTAE